MVLSDLCHAIDRARNIVTVEPVLLLYMLGSYLQFITVQQLIYFKVCVIEFNDTVMCNNLSAYRDEEKEVTKAASHWIIILNVALTVPSVISSLFLGSWSDRAGRRLVILLPPFGTIVYSSFLIVSAAFIYTSVWLIIAGQAILGATGAFPILTSAVFSYLGDVTNEKERTVRFGILESMTFIGSSIGLFTSGLVIDNLGYVAAFIYVIIVEVLIVLYVLLWLRESVPQNKTFGMVEGVEESVKTDLGEDKMRNRCRELLKVEHFVKSFAAVFRQRPQRRRLQIILLLVCLFLFELVGTGENDTVTLYVKKAPLSWNSTYIGYFSGARNLAKSCGLFTILPIAHFLGFGDPVIAAVATCFRMAGYVLMAFARTTALMFSVAIFMIFAAIPAACSRAMLSKLVSSSEQGSLFAFSAAMETTTSFLGSLVFNTVFPATQDIINGGLVYLLMAAILIVPVILLLLVRYFKKFDTTHQIEEDHSEEDPAITEEVSF